MKIDPELFSGSFYMLFPIVFSFRATSLLLFHLGWRRDILSPEYSGSVLLQLV
jgi:hypothetical protein